MIEVNEKLRKMGNENSSDDGFEVRVHEEDKKPDNVISTCYIFPFPFVL